MEETSEDLAVVLRYFDEFSDTQLQQLAALGPLYREWNNRINVISRKDITGLYEKHVLHSLAIAAVHPFRAGATILDLGTGGGFPGIPLAIFFPGLQFVLADSIAKKLKVVEAVAAALGLTNILTRHTRVEDIRHQKFDYVVSRAVAPLGDLWRWSWPLLRQRKFKGIANSSFTFEGDPLPPGLLCLKGGDLNDEIAGSETRPLIAPVAELFAEAYFNEKYLVYVPA